MTKSKRIGIQRGEQFPILETNDWQSRDREKIGWQRSMDALLNERDALRAELAAIKAQKPVAEVTGQYYAGLYDEMPIGLKLYTNIIAKE